MEKITKEAILAVMEPKKWYTLNQLREKVSDKLSIDDENKGSIRYYFFLISLGNTAVRNVLYCQTSQLKKEVDKLVADGKITPKDDSTKYRLI